MRSDHRHELKTNELADWIAHLPDWLRENRTNLMAAGAVLLVALLVYFWSFYRRDVVSTRVQTRLTNLIAQVPQQTNNIARAATQNDQTSNQSYTLLPIAQDLQDFAKKTSDNNMAALALIERGAALRAELHYRTADVPGDELIKQMGLAEASYQEALDRQPSSTTLAALAKYGVGLCEEELGNFDKAGAIYGELTQKPEYAGTTAEAAAAYRLKVMNDYRTAVVFPPAPPKPAAAAPSNPTAASNPTVVPAPAQATVNPPAPIPAPAATPTAAPTPAPAAAPQPAASAPAPTAQPAAPAAAAGPALPGPNAPKGN